MGNLLNRTLHVLRNRDRESLKDFTWGHINCPEIIKLDRTLFSSSLTEGSHPGHVFTRHTPICASVVSTGRLPINFSNILVY